VTGTSGERLHWTIEVGAATHRLDLIPGAAVRWVDVQADGRTIGRVPKPTPQRPLREAVFAIDGEPVLVALTWHFPVMLTDVFVRGRSVRDGRSIDAAHADAPSPLTNYEVWFGAMFRTPFFGSRPRPPRDWPALVLGCVMVWLLILAASPLVPALRLPAGVALLVTGVLLIVAHVWSTLAFGQRVHEALLVRPALGDWRVALWLAAFVGYALLVPLVAGALLLFASRLQRS
jgi:hypothetical protein